MYRRLLLTGKAREVFKALQIEANKELLWGRLVEPLESVDFGNN